MCEYCSIHNIEKTLINGKYYCFECLSKTDNDKPVRYENLSALNKMPRELQSCRFNNVFDGKVNAVKSLEKLIDDNALNQLDFNILWVKHSNPLNLYKIAATLANERLIRHLKAEYWDLENRILVERSSFSTNESEQVQDELHRTYNQPFHCVVVNELKVIDKITISRLCAYLNAYVKTAVLNGNFVVFFSTLSFDEYVESNAVFKNLLLPYKDMVKTISLSNKALINGE